MQNLYDVVVIGGGPAGLTAALYRARARYRVVVVEKEHFGGQITITHEVVNYPGVERTSGKELTENMRKQAESFGAEFMLAEVEGLVMDEAVKRVKTSRGELKCFRILLATGAHPRMIGFKGEDDFRGRGVAYCATCDGEFFTGKKVFVVGGGFAAAEESVFLTKYASHVTILVREPDFTCAKATAEAASRSMKTSVDGLYAAGDVCVKTLRQVVTAVGDGALAATELERYAAAMQRETGLHPIQPTPAAGATSEDSESGNKGSSQLFDASMLAQLNTVFSRMAAPLVLKLYLDQRPVSAELREYMEELASLTDKLTVEISDEITEEMPCVRIFRADGTWSGLAFHGVPGGHEFTSFVLGLYNAAGPGQTLDADVLERIRRIDCKVDIKVLVSLSCTMCPELVTATQRIAAESGLVTAEVYDLNHFTELRDRYHVMSVPCLVVNDGSGISFGKKSVRQILDLLKEIE